MPEETKDLKLGAFTDAIISEAIEESQNIVRELSLREKDIMQKAENDVSAEMEHYKRTRFAQIFAEESRRVSSRMTENKHTLLRYREDCAVETFKEAQDKIAAFTASEQYLPHLKALLNKGIGLMGYGFSAEILLRKEDMHFADELLESTYGVSLAFSEGDFTLGGLCLYCPSKGRRIDMTFDAALGDMVGHFAELTGLSMGE